MVLFSKPTMPILPNKCLWFKKPFLGNCYKKSFNIYQTQKDSIRSKNRTRDLSDKNFRVLPSGFPEKLLLRDQICWKK